MQGGDFFFRFTSFGDAGNEAFSHSTQCSAVRSMPSMDTSLAPTATRPASGDSAATAATTAGLAAASKSNPRFTIVAPSTAISTFSSASASPVSKRSFRSSLDRFSSTARTPSARTPATSMPFTATSRQPTPTSASRGARAAATRAPQPASSKTSGIVPGPTRTSATPASVDGDGSWISNRRSSSSTGAGFFGFVNMSARRLPSSQVFRSARGCPSGLGNSHPSRGVLWLCSVPSTTARSTLKFGMA